MTHHPPPHTAKRPITCAKELRVRIRELAIETKDPARVTETILRSLKTPDEFRVVTRAALSYYVWQTLHHYVWAEPEIPDDD